MSAPNPQVSVFHFTSRISSAKIRKYKLATERGMSSGQGNSTTTTSISGPLPTEPSPSIDTSTMEPPAKRPKLRLSVRRPDESPDSIAVSRPKRDTSLRIRYSENMIIDNNDLDEDDPQRKPRPSPAASSDLSSLTSTHSVEKEPTAGQAPEPSAGKRRDYSKDFMSYYVVGGDDDEENEVVETAPPQPVQPKPDPPKEAAQAPVVSDRAAKERRSKYQRRTSHPISKAQPPRLPLPQPVVEVVDSTSKSTELQGPDTIAAMVQKLERLSTALTNFGGIAAAPASPQEEVREDSDPRLSSEKKDVDTFLALFGDEDDSDEKESEEIRGGSNSQDFNYRLKKPGEADSALTYGIQFIQNALKSWAVQRTIAQYNQQYLQYYQTHNDIQAKRGPGRPRKFDGVDEDQRVPPPAAHIRINLAQTPEGAAISAFQDVLSSGCLQVNAVLPVRLSGALRRLYMQIDHLINQGARNEPPWQCMSYGAQIASQKSRVDKWKVAHAKAQEEMARQQDLAHQQVMQQMGIPQQQQRMTVEQVQQQHAIDLERKRSLQHAAQQPHLTPYLTNPLKLDTTPAGDSSSHVAAASPAKSIPISSPDHGPENGQAKGPQYEATQPNPADGKDVRLDKIKLYMPNYLPLSGQSMKFSFAPQSELALKTFGAEAFPNDNTGSSLTNRGPMTASPSMPVNQPSTPNGSDLISSVSSNALKPTVPTDSEVEMVGTSLGSVGHSSSTAAAPLPRQMTGVSKTSVSMLSAMASGAAVEERNQAPFTSSHPRAEIMVIDE